ncbi:MAG: methionyl-tRNA formyltransferase [Acidobacteria bacterium]|nr:methionyl-tRNA formyltransferase [Acidobacteriota bacterium]
MAIVKKLARINMDRDSSHTEVECTYTVISGPEGEKYLQIDTYGSALRKIPGKKSQSIRFSPEAVAQLREIIDKEL